MEQASKTPTLYAASKGGFPGRGRARDARWRNGWRAPTDRFAAIFRLQTASESLDALRLLACRAKEAERGAAVTARQRNCSSGICFRRPAEHRLHLTTCFHYFGERDTTRSWHLMPTRDWCSPPVLTRAGVSSHRGAIAWLSCPSPSALVSCPLHCLSFSPPALPLLPPTPAPYQP